jgi:UDP-glucose 4-epimerase
MTAKRAILTGGTGFVGACLARRLIRDGHDVHLLVRRGYAPWRIEGIRDHIRLHEVDLSDAAQTAQTVAAIRPEWVFHLAAYGAYSSQTDVQRIYHTNLTGTINLLEACLQTGFEAFINTGSSSEYGYKDHAPHEKEWVDPNSYYAAAKVAATLYCRYSAAKHNAHIVTLRLYSVYGAYEEPTRLIPTLITKGLRGELPPLVNPNIARDYVHIEDVNNACISATQRGQGEPGAVYNIGTGVQTSLREVVDAARDLMGIPAEPQWGSMPDRGWDTNVWVSDPAAAMQALGWKPGYPFRDGLRDTIQWFRDHPDMLAYYEQNRTPPR